MIKFSEAVKTQRSGCSKCFSFIYTLPYRLEKEIQNYLTAFGKPLYPLKAVKLLRIDTPDGFHIEGKLGTKNIKFVIPKVMETANPDLAQQRKKEFERCLAEWLTAALDITVIVPE